MQLTRTDCKISYLFHMIVQKEVPKWRGKSLGAKSFGDHTWNEKCLPQRKKSEVEEGGREEGEGRRRGEGGEGGGSEGMPPLVKLSF